MRIPLAIDAGWIWLLVQLVKNKNSPPKSQWRARLPAGDCHRMAGKKIAGKYEGKKCNNYCEWCGITVAIKFVPDDVLMLFTYITIFILESIRASATRTLFLTLYNWVWNYYTYFFPIKNIHIFWKSPWKFCRNLQQTHLLLKHSCSSALTHLYMQIELFHSESLDHTK